MTSPAGRGLAVVTGAGSGIGAATAAALHEAGHPILAIGRDKPRLRRAAPADAMIGAVDIRDRATVAAVLTDATTRYGPVEILVNNAGILPLGDLTRQNPAEWQEAIETNCLAAFALAQLVAPEMVRRRRGTIVTVTSRAAREVYDHHGAYCASKAAAHAMSVALRGELAPHGVRVIEILPGFVDADISAATTDPALRAQYLAERPRGLPPQAVAEAIRYGSTLPPDVCLEEIVIAATGR